MPIGEKLFEEDGQATGFKILKVHPVEGTEMEISAAFDVKGYGRFPSGKEMGSGTLVHYPHGITQAHFHGNLITPEGDQILWWAQEKGRFGEDGKMRGVALVSFYTSSQKHAWLNNLIALLETEFDPKTQKVKTVGYEWKG
jgi:hypothetical protein